MQALGEERIGIMNDNNIYTCRFNQDEFIKMIKKSRITEFFKLLFSGDSSQKIINQRYVNINGEIYLIIGTHSTYVQDQYEPKHHTIIVSTETLKNAGFDIE